jgi:hypothetical protein
MNHLIDMNGPEPKAIVTLYLAVDLLEWVRQKEREWGKSRSATLAKLVDDARAREQEAAR